MNAQKLHKLACLKLAQKKIENPNKESLLLLANSINWGFGLGQLLAKLDDIELTSAEITTFNNYILAREAFMPIAYILNKSPFYGLDFFVNENCLIPRPETEFLVEYAIKHLTKSLTVLDICTGSGAIAVSLKKNRLDLNIIASDLSFKALEVTKKNKLKHSCQIHLLQMDCLSAIKKVDCILANPPYIAKDFKNSLAKDIIDYEPHLALFADEEGSYLINKILKESLNCLKEKGTLMLEIGKGQASLTIKKAKEFKLNIIDIIKDYLNIERILIFEKG